MFNFFKTTSLSLIFLSTFSYFGCSYNPPIDPSVPRTIVREEYSDGKKYSLSQKTDLLEDIIQKFISKEGTLQYYKINNLNYCIDYCIGADTCIWGGILLASESFRYSILKKENNPKSEEALSVIKKLLKGLEKLDDITGKEGFYARNFVLSLSPLINEKWKKGKNGFSDYFWKGDVSKDQYIGLVFGYSIAYQLVDEHNLKSRIKKRVKSIADFLIENNFSIKDLDNKETTYGSLDNKIAGFIPDGVSSLITLNIIKNAAFMTKEKKYEEEYEKLIKEGYADTSYWAKFQIIGKTNYNNDNMAFLAYYNLLNLEKNPKIRKRIFESMERTWSYIKDDLNSFWNFIYNSTSENKDINSIEQAIESLRLYSLNRKVFGIDHRWRKDIEKNFWSDRKGIPQSTKPFPINQRGISSFIWKSNPYILFSDLGTKGEEECAPTDYLIAYWIGRYHNLIKKED